MAIRHYDRFHLSIDRVAARPVVPATDAPDAPIDQQLKSEVIQTAPET